MSASAENSISPMTDRDSVDRAILDAVRSIRFGSVEVVVHNSTVVQIECREKIRFETRPTRS